MRAVLCREWGEPSTLAIEEVERPAPDAGEVRISVRASGVNFADALMVAGKYQFKPPFPFSPGFEVSGVVVEAGGGVASLGVGDRVMAALPHGGYAEEVVVPEANVVQMPEGMDFPTAASFPVAYGTAHLALTRRANLGAEDVLLVHGASGNVGRAAVEIGKRLGATVVATGGGPESLEVAARHGADHAIDYGREDVRDRVLEITDGRGGKRGPRPGGRRCLRRLLALCGVGRCDPHHRFRQRQDTGGPGLEGALEELRRDGPGLGRLPQTRPRDRQSLQRLGTPLVRGGRAGSPPLAHLPAGARRRRP